MIEMTVGDYVRKHMRGFSQKLLNEIGNEVFNDNKLAKIEIPLYAFGSQEVIVIYSASSALRYYHLLCP
jgi:hypothetical protein